MASGEELLCNAVKGGDVVTLDGLLNQYRGIDVNFKTGEGLNLLMVAIREAGQNQRGQFNEVVQLLVQIGCDVNAIDDQYGRTAAHWAVYYHKEDILMELLIAGADVSLPDYSGISPFLLAIQETSVKCVSTMMRYSPKEMLNYPDHEGRSPLLYAIYGGSVQMCSLLVELGASINLPDQVTGRTPFHWACLNGQKDIIDFFCQKESDVQAQDGEGRLPVHLAATCEQKEGLQVLFKAYGSNVLELVDVGGLTPLMYACASSLEESIKYLLKKKVNVLAEDNDGKSCLHWAVEASTPEAVLCVQLLCKTHPELTKQRDQVGRTPLLWACVQSSVSNLSILIDLRDDVTVVDNDEHTAAHWATVSGSPKCLSLLAQSGAPVTLRDKNGATPLHYAAQNSRDTTDNSLSDTLYTGSPQGILECLQILLDCGADVEATDNEGNTPFHWGIQSPNNFTALSYLVGAGVDPNRKNNDGQTGLHLAAKQGITENCQFLIEAVGDVAVEGDNEGQTPLFNAVEGGHVECARYLISIGANVNHLNHEKRSPIHVASSVGSVECVQLLSSSGADLQQRTVHGALPIHEAAANGHTAVLEFLLYNGCEVNSKVVGGTALHYAASGGHLEAAQLLIDCGVHINALVETTDENYYVSALDYAEASGNSELVDLIKSHRGRSGEDVAKKSVFVIQKHLRRHKLKMKKQGRKEESVKEKKGAAVTTAEQEQRSPLQSVPEDTVVPQLSLPTTPEKGRETAGEFPRSPVKEEHSSGVEQLGDQPASSSTLERPQSSVQDVFEPPKPPSRPPSSVGFPSPSKPQKPANYAGEPPPRTMRERQQSVLQRALGLFKKDTRPENTLNSAVGLYGAAALMLMGALAGGKLGEKTTEVGEKVAWNRGEEVEEEMQEKTGQDLPELVWDEPPEEPTPISTPSPPPVKSPTPEPSESEEDPLDRRLRKAKAQLSLNRSVAFNAVSEMAKAQATNARLKREFDFKRLDDDIAQWRSDVRKKEMISIEKSEKIKSQNRERMVKATARSKIVNYAIDEVLLEAKHRNNHLDCTVSKMGYAKRPTVAQWLEQKKLQKKRELQEEMVQWDRDRYKRELALTVTQTTTAKRAYKHMAWAKRKELQGKIRKLKAEEDMLKSLKTLEPYSAFEKRLRSTRSEKKSLFPKPPSVSSRNAPSAVRPLRPRMPSTATSSQVLREASYDDVHITTQGFVKMPSNPQSKTAKKRSKSFGEEKLWSYGESVARGKTTPTLSALKQLNKPEYIRATGPKSTPRVRSLVFVPPEQYRPPSRSKRKVHPKSPTSSGAASSVKLTMTRSQEGLVKHSGPKSPTTQYHSLAGGSEAGNRTQSPARSPHKTPAQFKVVPVAKPIGAAQHQKLVSTQ